MSEPIASPARLESSSSPSVGGSGPSLTRMELESEGRRLEPPSPHVNVSILSVFK